MMPTINLKCELTYESKFFTKSKYSFIGGWGMMFMFGQSYKVKVNPEFYFKTDIIAN